MINYLQVPLTHRQTISKSHQLVMQRQVPTTILRTDTDEHLSILREMLRSINSKKRPFNGTGPIFNNFVSSVGRREVERYMLEAIDSDLQTFVLDTGCVSLETLKRLDAEKAMRYNFFRDLSSCNLGYYSFECVLALRRRFSSRCKPNPPSHWSQVQHKISSQQSMGDASP